MADDEEVFHRETGAGDMEREDDQLTVYNAAPPDVSKDAAAAIIEEEYFPEEEKEEEEDELEEGGGLEGARDVDRLRKEQKSKAKKVIRISMVSVEEDEEEEEEDETEQPTLLTEEERGEEEDEFDEDIAVPNTFKLDSSRPFDEKHISQWMQNLIDEELTDYVYDPLTAPKITRSLTLAIMQYVHSQHFHRHKIIVTVDLTEKIYQGVHSTVRFLWDADRDNIALAILNRDTFYIACCVLALNYD